MINVPIRVDDSGRLPYGAKRLHNTQFSDRAFAVASQTAWNRLSADIRQLKTIDAFRRHLKTTCSERS